MLRGGEADHAGFSMATASRYPGNTRHSEDVGGPPHLCPTCSLPIRIYGSLEHQKLRKHVNTVPFLCQSTLNSAPRPPPATEPSPQMVQITQLLIMLKQLLLDSREAIASQGHPTEQNFAAMASVFTVSGIQPRPGDDPLVLLERLVETVTAQRQALQART
ncbi:hypothetical protein PAPYR_10491 [Paratrimastix pyriformis]|uniref:Uncharacterized protein n=1 Tax=Paratrimastix pyriformis TaxID=342808 RepID=A0ABQ8UBH8_9EUKA|nr:hypothetical protein PAPYR_10491 [Paratrimastix pyriformis]